MKLDLGCGYRKPAGYIGLDNRQLPGVDVVCDINQGLPYPDSSVDEIRAHDFLEHMDPSKRIFVITEIWRVLKPGGILDSKTPCALSQAHWQDPTHTCPWVENSWIYFTDKAHRELYGIIACFKPEELITTQKNAKGQAWVIARMSAIK